MLEWDSGFFGLKVGKLKSNGSLPEAEFDDFDLVYVFSDIPLTRQTFPNLYVLPVDRKVTYSMQIAANPGLPEGVGSYVAGDHDPEVVRLGIQSGMYSRFKRDPNFADGQFEQLFSVWMRRSIDREIADEVFVCISGGLPRGVITLRDAPGFASIGIVAVDESVRGQGIGRKLVQAARHYAHQHHFPALEVITQEENEQACRFYEKEGFSLKKKEYIYHFWNKGADRDRAKHS